MKKILWICGRLPTPLFAGDALYSAGLLKALAELNEVEVTVVGVKRSEHQIERPLLSLPQVTCIDVPPSGVSGSLSLLSPLPKDAYVLATPALREALLKLLNQSWDWLVIDHAYSSGLLDVIVERRKSAAICYIGHNAEGLIRPEIARNFENPIRRAVMKFDASKYRKLEKKLLQRADAVICITSEDRSYFRQFADRTYVIPPVFLGVPAPPRSITPEVPRTLLLLGAFEWVAKQKNLKLIVDTLLPQFKQHGICLDVVGTVPKDLRDRLQAHKAHLTFHGRVSNISDIVSKCRGGLVPELLGGGFKLKVLDYAFSRLPIFGLTNALAGTTAEEQSAMFLARDIAALGDAIVENIDQVDRLNRSQEKLFALFSDRFALERAASQIRQVFLS